MKGVILLVFDGLGLSLPGPGNAYFLSGTQNFKKYFQLYPHTQLKASGEAVGLPSKEVGSTEVGHINLGAGKIVYQSLPRINLSIADGSFFKNKQFLTATEHVKKHGSNFHIIGLLGNGTVHASTAHLHALLFLCKENGIENVYLHLITDGRDSPPKAAETYLDDIQKKLDQLKIGKIATIMGRYYGMDRDRRWERIEKAYKCLTEGAGEQGSSWKEVIENSYADGKTDEFILPTSIVEPGQNPTTIRQNDAVVFYNFRIDRPRELTKAFVLDNFEADANKMSFDPYTIKYHRKHEMEDSTDPINPPFNRGPKIPNLFFGTMTEYEKNLPVYVAFPPHVVNMPLGRVLADNGMSQLRMAESEKERFVTIYFNGLRTEPFPMEDRIIVPSPKISTYDLKPEMSSVELTDVLVQKIEQGNYKFILTNYANPDMVGHTGNIQAAIKAVMACDNALGRIVEAAQANDYTVIVTSDHGNVEEMIDSQTGGVSTEHSGNNVPFIVINKQLESTNATLQSGILADVAPTILGLLNIPKPTDMTGRDLLEELKAKS